MTPLAAKVEKLIAQFREEADTPIPGEFAADVDAWTQAFFKRSKLRQLAEDLHILVLVHVSGPKLRAGLKQYLAQFYEYRERCEDTYDANPVDSVAANEALGRIMAYSRAIRLVKRDILGK